MTEEKEKFDSAMKEVIGGILEAADRERKKDPDYIEMFGEGAEYEGVLRNLNMKMVKHVLDACEVLKQRHDWKSIGNDAFFLLLAIPVLEHILEKRFVDEEGHTCCVDKVYYTLAKILGGLKPEEVK